MQHAKICAAVVLVLAPVGALAQSSAPATPSTLTRPSPELKQAHRTVRAACAADVQKFCANVERGNGGVRACLREHRTELSADCTAARQALRAVRRQQKS